MGRDVCCCVWGNDPVAAYELQMMPKVIAWNLHCQRKGERALGMMPYWNNMSLSPGREKSV
jgi:hypothetical protein